MAVSHQLSSLRRRSFPSREGGGGGGRTADTVRAVRAEHSLLRQTYLRNSLLGKAVALALPLQLLG